MFTIAEIRMRPTRGQIENFSISPKMWAKALQYCDEHKEELVRAAAFSQRHAVSHRAFQVGCAAIGLGPNLEEGEYIVRQAYNFTPTPKFRKGSEKRCAERNALEAAQSDCKAVLGIATSSRGVYTGDSTKAHNALHPCRDCRDYYRDLLRRGFLREDTRILSGNNSGEETLIETRTLKELLNLYLDDA